ncbi:MAG TPA: iron-sulfur binding hydrogenase [Thermotogota bacterium]|nr:iron-sulfur binding hydrogenase [Thermotogota bacterium]HPJ89782.1 iron-sulfur binding hydrogenase [Thermotogota bacterium]HPR95736.1 iron-sulfur binding hydrogenase [Thermotogota bacterium]
MRLTNILENIDAKVICGDPTDVEIKSGYTSDLLSEVMACGNADLWITVQSHSNIVAVATIIGVKCIFLVNGREYSQDTINKAEQENIVLVTSKENAFQLTGKIHAMLQS